MMMQPPSFSRDYLPNQLQQLQDAPLPQEQRMLQEQQEGSPSKKIKTERAMPSSELELMCIERALTYSESQGVEHLCRMGFSKLEALKALRSVADKMLEVSVPYEQLLDQAMFHIVKEREEADENRKMDNARLESENDKEYMRGIIKQTEEAEMSEASNADTIISRFSESSVLARNINVVNVLANAIEEGNEMKTVAVKLLTLERNALRWYGQRCHNFLKHVLGASLGDGGGVANCVEMLEKALYDLEGQKGGIPAVFFEAEKKYGKDTKESVDEDCEIVIDPAFVKKNENDKDGNVNRNGNGNSNCRAMDREIIEIADESEDA